MKLFADMLRQLRQAWDLGGVHAEDFDGLPLPYRPARKTRFRRETRRCRKTYALGMLKRILVTSPIVILSIFGALHILEALIGRSSLFWDVNRVEFKFLPELDRLHRFDNGLFRSTVASTHDVLPISCHSHNDYWRRVPLFDAISWGCTGVEADVWLFDEELYVGHSISSLTRQHTLRSLYVDKLVELLDSMNTGDHVVAQTDSLNGVFQSEPEQTLTLLVDLKNNAHEAFPILSEQLQALRDKNYLTYWNGQKIIRRPVTVVGTGDTPFDLVVANTTYRDIFFDAPLDRLWERPRDPIGHQDPIHKLDSKVDYGHAMSIPADDEPFHHEVFDAAEYDNTEKFNTNTSYYASVSFEKTVGFVWRGHLSPRQMELIRGQIRGAKRRGLKIRYWNTPSWPIALRNHVWHVLMKEGADMLNVDDLAAAARQSWNLRVHQLW